MAKVILVRRTNRRIKYTQGVEIIGRGDFKGIPTKFKDCEPIRLYPRRKKFTIRLSIFKQKSRKIWIEWARPSILA